MKRTIITSGCSFIDIDAAACLLALKNIKKKNNENIFLNISYIKSSSIIKKYRNILDRENSIQPQKDQNLILVDTSGVDYLKDDCGFDLENVVEIFDHHLEHTDFWKEKIGKKSRIEKVGAAATLVYEYGEEMFGKKILNILSDEIQEMMIVAILHNTQNFQTEFSCKRDERVFHILKENINFSEEQKKEYFQEVDRDIFEKPRESLVGEIKSDAVVNGNTFLIIQIEMFQSLKFIQEQKKLIESFLKNTDKKYSFFMSASIEDRGTYFLTHDKETQRILSNLLNIEFEKDTAFFSKIILRKEIIYQMNQKSDIFE